MLNLLKITYPNAKTELIYNNPYQLLLAVVMSAQTTDKAVNKVTASLFKKVKNPSDLLKLNEDKLSSMIKSIGLWRTKTKNILKISQILENQYHGEIPKDHQDLCSLPGVGRKTAAVVLNTLYKQPYIAVDTHVFRVANRTQLATGKTPYDVEMNFYKLYKATELIELHQQLIMHGRYTCTAKNPKCSTCILSSLCPSKA